MVTESAHRFDEQACATLTLKIMARLDGPAMPAVASAVLSRHRYDAAPAVCATLKEPLACRMRAPSTLSMQVAKAARFPTFRTSARPSTQSPILSDPRKDKLSVAVVSATSPPCPLE
jgi:hypothetical protein